MSQTTLHVALAEAKVTQEHVATCVPATSQASPGQGVDRVDDSGGLSAEQEL